MQLPGNKERTPVDKGSYLSQVISVKRPGPRKSRSHRLKAFPVDSRLMLLRFREGQVLLDSLFIVEVILQLGVFAAYRSKEVGLLLIAQQRAYDGNTAGCIEDMNNTPVEFGSDLD